MTHEEAELYLEDKQFYGDNVIKCLQGGPKKRGHSVLQKYCSDLHDFFCRNQSRLILNTKT